MADSYIIYTASGSTDTFNIPFGYLDPEHVFVSVDNVDVSFTFPSESQVELDAGNPANGAKVKVYRVTPRDSREVVWSNAANLTAGDLNTADLQMLYITQEAFDTVEDAILKDDTGIYDANSIRIQNVATPSASTDAANKAYVDASTVDIVDDAEDARDDAITAQLAAEAALAACLVVYDNFDDRYLGQKSSAPTLDNDGNALIDGALYYNTVDNKMYVYDLGTTSWLAIETNIPDDAITNAKLSNMAQSTIKGRASGAGTGDPTDLTPAQARAVLSVLPSIDEDTMSSNVDTSVPTQQSVKAYVDANKVLKSIAGSADQTITSAGSLTPSHSLGQIPTFVLLSLVCQTAEHGYSVGDIVPVGFVDSSGAASGQGVSVNINSSTQLQIRYGSSTTVFILLHKTTGAVVSATNANWKARFTCVYIP